MVPRRPLSVFRAFCGLIVCLGCLTAVAQESSPLAIRIPRIALGLTPASSLAESPAELPAPTADARGQVELVTERYPDGTVKIERQVTQDAEGNYVNHGSFTMFDRQGMILRSGQFRNGKQHGEWIRYFQAGEGTLFSGDLAGQFPGPFVSKAVFLDGQLHGTWTIMSRTRRKIIEWQFENGVRNGNSTWWYPNGQQRRQVMYKEGEPNGQFLEWNPDGTLATKANFIDGRVLTKKTKWYGPGQKFYEGSYLTTQDFIEPTFDWWNGTSTSISIDQSGPDLKHGTWAAWYRNGQKKVEGQYREDVPNGEFTWWYESGQKQAEGEYADGLESGTWITWHPNGLKESVGEYTAGVLTGKWMRWAPDGKLAEIHDFSLEPLEQGKERADSDVQRGDDHST